MTARAGATAAHLLDLVVCPICHSSIKEKKKGVLVCTGCSEEYPLSAHSPCFLTSAVLDHIAISGIGGERVDRWTLSLNSTNAWRERKINFTEKAIPFAPKLTRDHCLDASVVSRFLSLRSYARGRQILDLGCGTGFRLGQFSECNYVGLDPSVSSDCRLFSFVQGIAEALPFRDGMFDLVLCIDVLDHVISPELALKESLRIIGPRGRLYILVGDSGDAAYLRHRKYRQMFGIPEVRAHLHQFNDDFFRRQLSGSFDEINIFRSNGFIFIDCRGKSVIGR